MRRRSIPTRRPNGYIVWASNSSFTLHRHLRNKSWKKLLHRPRFELLAIKQDSNGGWNPTRCMRKAKGRCELSKLTLIWEALAKRMMDQGHGGRRKAALFWLRSEVGGRQRGRPTEETTTEKAKTNDNDTTNEKWENDGRHGRSSSSRQVRREIPLLFGYILFIRHL